MTTHKFTFEANFSYEDYWGRDHDVSYTVTYGVNGHEVEILSVKNWRDQEVATNSIEDDYIYDEACSRADADMNEWHAEQAEYRAEMIREDRDLLKWENNQ